MQCTSSLTFGSQLHVCQIIFLLSGVDFVQPHIIRMPDRSIQFGCPQAVSHTYVHILEQGPHCSARNCWNLLATFPAPPPFSAKRRPPSPRIDRAEWRGTSRRRTPSGRAPRSACCDPPSAAAGNPPRSCSGDRVQGWTGTPGEGGHKGKLTVKTDMGFWLFLVDQT